MSDRLPRECRPTFDVMVHVSTTTLLKYLQARHADAWEIAHKTGKIQIFRPDEETSFFHRKPKENKP